MNASMNFREEKRGQYLGRKWTANVTEQCTYVERNPSQLTGGISTPSIGGDATITDEDDMIERSWVDSKTTGELGLGKGPHVVSDGSFAGVAFKILEHGHMHDALTKRNGIELSFGEGFSTAARPVGIGFREDAQFAKGTVVELLCEVVGVGGSVAAGKGTEDIVGNGGGLVVYGWISRVWITVATGIGIVREAGDNDLWKCRNHER